VQFVDNFRAAAAAPSIASASADDVASQVAAPRPEPAVTQAQEINALAMLWGLVKGWFAGLIGKRT